MSEDGPTREKSSPAHVRRGLAARLNFLFDRIRRPDGTRFSNEEVAEYMTVATGKPTGRAYLSALRRGTKDNPTMGTLQALASFFDVNPGYFFDGELADRISDQVDIAKMLTDPDLRAIAVRILAEVEPEDAMLVARLLRSVQARRRAVSVDAVQAENAAGA